MVALSAIPSIAAQPGLGAPAKGLGLAGLAVTLAVRIAEFRRRRLLAAWTELPQAVALTFAAFAAGPFTGGVGLFYSTCFFRAVYASTRRTLVATAGSIALLALSASLRGQFTLADLISQGFGIAAATLLTRMLLASLTQQNDEVVRGERQLTAVFDNLDVAVMVRATEATPVLMNRAARDLYAQLGLPPPPAPWPDVLAVYAGDGRTPLPPEQLPSALARQGHHVRDLDIVMQLHDGTRRYFSVNATPMSPIGGEPRALVAIHDVSARRQAQAELAHLATHDPLTGLANRTLLSQAIEEALARLRSEGTQATVILLDLDGFKRVNDSHGHAFGDEVLQAVGDRLQASVRTPDMVARLGGDEFAVLAGAGDPAVELARRIAARLTEPVTLPRSQVSLSASIGLVHLESEHTAADVLAAADLAMYTAKATGRGLVQVFHADLRHALDQRLLLEVDLQRALDRDEFELHYQPFVNLETGTVTGSEALLRWRHPTRGLMPPHSFIPILEDNGAIVPVGRWILATACSAAAAWRLADPARLRTVSVNVSARQLEDAGIVVDVARALAGAGLPAQALTVEITESALVAESPAVLERLQGLKSLGVKIAVDDFGTGYSSLSRLRTFPVDILKIDRSFVVDVENEKGEALVRAILAVADALQIDVVAEGVETPGQARAMAALGTRVVQGFLFGKPAPASASSPPAISLTGTAFLLQASAPI